jgi:hypothetical protein
LIDQYIIWNGYSNISIWKDIILIKGTDGTQFHPNLNQNELLSVWSSDFYRTIYLNYSETVNTFGIKLFRYKLSNQVFNINETFYQNIYGFINLTAIPSTNGLPLFISKMNMLDVSNEWINKINGIIPNETTDDPYFDVEPITGITMNAQEKFQLNLFLSNNTNYFNFFNQNVTTGLFYPLTVIYQSSEITESQANSFKNSVYLAFNLVKVDIAVFTVLAIMFLIIELFFLFPKIKKKIKKL